MQQLQSSNIDVELVSFEDYSAEYLRSILPGPVPAWSTAAAAVEVVLRPSFTPEVILRLWSAGPATAAVQLATEQTSIWFRRFNRPPWLTGIVDELDEIPAEETME